MSRTSILWSACLLGASGCALEERWDSLSDAGPPLTFAFPILERGLISTLSIGIDHDQEDQQGSLGGDAICTDYAGRSFPFCYDQHSGHDYLLRGGFDTMDEGSATVLAAADGIVVETQDGHYDRCRLSGTKVDCAGGPLIANFIKIEHYSGVVSKYWHLMEGSLLVEPGEEVSCGQPIARIGSSGNSSMPHLHFGVETNEGWTLDPYAGPFSQETSLWEDQGVPEALPGAGCSAR